MEWFRLYHGTISDPKWTLISRKAKVSIGIIVSVWLSLLEHASQNSPRGSIIGYDDEVVDALFGYDDGTTQRVIEAMMAADVLIDGAIASWRKRQPLREDMTRNERVARHREKQRNADVTQGNACNVLEQNRTEQNRAENKKDTPTAQRPAKAPAAPAWKWWIDVNRACGRPDPVAVGKDTSASRTLARAIPQETECKEIMRRYLRDTDPFLTKTGYPLSFLLQRINRYRSAPGGATTAQPSPYKQLGETA